MIHRKTYIVSLLIYYCVTSHGQVVHVEINNDGQIDIMPSRQFVQEKKVNKVSYEYSTKKPNQIIKSSPDFKTETYNFNGQLLELKQKKQIGGTTVQSHIINTYSDDKLNYTIEKDHIGYIKTIFAYSGDTIFEDSFRAAHYDPEFKRVSNHLDSTLINSSYKISQPTITRHYNKNGLHIKTNYIELDSLSLLKSEKLAYTLSPQKIIRLYSYNAEGLCSEMILESQSGTKTFKYYYDHMNVLERIEEWVAEKNTSAIELVYDSGGWLNAIIRQNPENNHIKITKLSYNTD